MRRHHHLDTLLHRTYNISINDWRVQVTDSSIWAALGRAGRPV
jgi:hypothetical protein